MFPTKKRNMEFYLDIFKKTRRMETKGAISGRNHNLRDNRTNHGKKVVSIQKKLYM
jgi:hypothetical protein